MQEVLRMYPPVGIGQLRVTFKHELVLARKLTVPKGTIMWVPHHALQNVSFNWDDPDKFLPGMSHALTALISICPAWHATVDTRAKLPLSC